MSKLASCIIRFWKPSVPASDGSIIPQQVFETYLRSPEYQESIESGAALGTLTHRSRDQKCIPSDLGENLRTTIGKDDQMLITDPRCAAPVWRLKRIFIDGEWVKAEMEILDEHIADTAMKEQITRLKALLLNGCMLGVSAVVVAYWDNQGGTDVCKKIHQIKSIDLTNNPAMKGSRVLEYNPNEPKNMHTEEYQEETSPRIINSRRPVRRRFSETDSTVPEVRMFSDLSEYSTLPKSSKIGLSYTTLKVKEFSSLTQASGLSENLYSVTSLKERIRVATKMTPRIQFRRLILDYKQAIKSMGGVEKIPEADLKIIKSLFTTDVLDIIKRIYPEVMKGKQIATLIGASTISKSTRQAAQKLQIPFRLASQQQEKQGYITKDRYQKIQEAYLEFVNSIMDEVFSSKPLISETPADLEDDDVENQG